MAKPTRGLCSSFFSSRLESNRGVLRDCELSVMAKVTHARDGRLSRRGRSCLFSWKRATRDHRNRLRRSNVYPVMLCASTECTWMRQMPPTACPNFKQQTSKHGRAPTERWFVRHPESPRKKHSQNGNSYFSCVCGWVFVEQCLSDDCPKLRIFLVVALTLSAWHNCDLTISQAPRSPQLPAAISASPPHARATMQVARNQSL